MSLVSLGFSKLLFKTDFGSSTFQNLRFSTLRCGRLITPFTRIQADPKPRNGLWVVLQDENGKDITSGEAFRRAQGNWLPWDDGTEIERERISTFNGNGDFLKNQDLGTFSFILDATLDAVAKKVYMLQTASGENLSLEVNSYSLDSETGGLGNKTREAAVSFTAPTIKSKKPSVYREYSLEENLAMQFKHDCIFLEEGKIYWGALNSDSPITFRSTEDLLQISWSGEKKLVLYDRQLGHELLGFDDGSLEIREGENKYTWPANSVGVSSGAHLVSNIINRKFLRLISAGQPTQTFTVAEDLSVLHGFRAPQGLAAFLPTLTENGLKEMFVLSLDSTKSLFEISRLDGTRVRRMTAPSTINIAGFEEPYVADLILPDALYFDESNFIEVALTVQRDSIDFTPTSSQEELDGTPFAISPAERDVSVLAPLTSIPESFFLFPGQTSRYPLDLVTDLEENRYSVNSVNTDDESNECVITLRF